MRRKIAFGITAAMTLVLLILRTGIISAWNELKIGPVDSAHLMPFIVVALVVAIAVLCFSKEPLPYHPRGAWKTSCGWFATFAGAVMTLTMVYAVFCLFVFGEVPPPNNVILNQIDLFAMIFMLVFGVAGGVFLALIGFTWMAGSHAGHPILSWLSITPTLWMWFRLARYEISYASTVDISENVFDFATMIFTSLFLLQFARVIMGIGKTPKFSLLVFALCTAMVTLSGVPSEFLSIPDGASLSLLLFAVVDVVIGLFAAVYATSVVFTNEQSSNIPALDTDDNENDTDEYVEEIDEEEEPIAAAWTTPVRDPSPVDPPFDIDELLGIQTSDSNRSSDNEPSVDDILADLNIEI